jgi:ATP10 protein
MIYRAGLRTLCNVNYAIKPYYRRCSTGTLNNTSFSSTTTAKATPRSTLPYTPMKYSDASWTDLSIIKRKGTAFTPDTKLLIQQDSMIFPPVCGINLNGKDTIFPNQIHTKVKLICFSFTDYGFNLNKSYKDSFIDKYANNDQIAVLEICFVEYGFLKMMKGMFQSNLKKKIPDTHHHHTQVTFGGVLDLARKIGLPSKFAGYCFLLDESNLIRWRASGLAEDNLQVLFDATDALLKETGK